MSYRYFGMTIPDDTIASIQRYIQYGVPTGGFLEAVICNDLYAAVSRADDTHVRLIPAIVAYLHNEVPAGAWGRADSFRKWMEMKRNERERTKCEEVSEK